MNPPLPLSNPVVGVTLRSILGAYVIFMARRFYANPTGYFRKSMRALPDLPWLAPVVRAMALFCLWGGCFIVATAFAVQVFGLHGDVLGLALALMAGLATWLLLPKRPVTDWEDDSSRGHPDGFS
jgi:hypothetical protein